VLHLGNLGFGHRTETIVEAASRLADTEITFLFVGGGVRFPELAEAARGRGLHNVVFRGYVPKDETPSVLAGAACSLISLDDRSLGIMSPCKMNGSLAMGLPIVYAGPTGSTVDEAIATYACGFSLRHDDVDGLVASIRRLHDEPGVAAEMARHARRAFEETFSDRSALPRFDAVFDRGTGGAAMNSERSSQALPGVDASPC
jgi:glycosyltransferase involved in cell wall biosynthesis